MVLYEHVKAMVKDGHEVCLVTARYKQKNGGAALEYEYLDGVEVFRVGQNRFLHSFQALLFYNQKLKNKYDIIIEVVNTAPYFVGFFKGYSNHYLFYHQLAREVWFYETGFPMAHIGYYILEPIATFIQSLLKSQTITISQSSKKDLMRFGFRAENIHIISEGIQNPSLPKFDPSQKDPEFTVLFHSSLRKMKLLDEAIKAFADFAESIKKDKV